MSDLIKRLSLRGKPKQTTHSRDAGIDSPSSSSFSTANSSADARSASVSEKHSHSLANRDSVDLVHDGRTQRGGILGAGHELVSKLHLPGRRSSSQHSAAPLNRDGEEMSKNQLKKRNKEEEKQNKTDWHTRQSMDLERVRQDRERKADEADTSEMRKHYGVLPINNYAGQREEVHFTKAMELTSSDIGQPVEMRVRLHNIRKLSTRLSFIILRQGTATIQGVLQEGPAVSKHFVQWAEHLPLETLVLVKGTVQKPKAKEGEVSGTSIHDKEIFISDMHVVSQLTEHLPFSVNEAEVTEAEADAEGSTRHHVSDRARLNARVLDLRTTTSQAIFRIQGGVCRYFRGYLDTQGFTEIHTPKLQGGATESGASVFKVQYFDREAFLAQSPQLAKQMSIAADFGRVYEIGAVFRAENSNTHRHLTEYTGLDLEMAIDQHYWEMRDIVDNTIKSIFKGIYENYRHEIDTIKRQFPHDDLVWLDETPIIPFEEAIEMLNATGWVGEDGKPLPVDEDLGTRDEIQMGKVIKEKYNTDYYILDKFPLSARPFYTMPDPEDPTYSNSFDVFVRGQEIISGGQRVHDAKFLAEQMKKKKVDPRTMEDYMSGFEWGAPPHGGCGIGLERIVMLMLQLGDIRHASMYPRDPKSLPPQPVLQELRHPEASTMHPPWEGTDKRNAQHDLQPLEKLIANYGDASNTSWLEPRFVIWRDGETGAAIGYVPHNGFAITIGDPLCAEAQYTKIIGTYLSFLKRETDLKPLWLLCGGATQDVLGERFDWRTFSCAAEQRLDITAKNAAHVFKNAEVMKKVRHAERENVKYTTIGMGEEYPEEFKQMVEQRLVDWQAGRKSHQNVHLTDVHPWQDLPHRQMTYATCTIDGKPDQLAALVIMAVLSPKHGWQIKFPLDFPGSPNGAIEATIVKALEDVQSQGATKATFGGGASHEFRPGHNLRGTKIKLLSRAYQTIASEFKLTAKTDFRGRFGAVDDPIYVCYPPKGLGPRGIRAILSFFES